MSKDKFEKKNEFSIKDYPVGRQPWRNNKVKNSTVKNSIL